MTIYFSFIGDIDDPDFYWDDPNACPKQGNLPRRLVPSLAYESLGVSIFYVMRLAREGQYEGRQIDWGAWGLKMTGAQLQAFLRDIAGEYAEQIAALDPGKSYVLVAAEDA